MPPPKSCRTRPFEASRDVVEGPLEIASVARWIGQPDRTVLVARQQDRCVRWCRHLAALVLGPQLELDSRPVAVGEEAPDNRAAQPLRVAHVVELPELAVELPEPC